MFFPAGLFEISDSKYNFKTEKWHIFFFLINQFNLINSKRDGTNRWGEMNETNNYFRGLTINLIFPGAKFSEISYKLSYNFHRPRF